MTHPVETLFKGEQPLIDFQIVDKDGTAIDLTGLSTSAINVYLRQEGQSANLYSSGTAANAITDAANGKFNYKFPSVIAVTGNVKGQVVIQFAADHVRITEYFDLVVEDAIKP